MLGLIETCKYEEGWNPVSIDGIVVHAIVHELNQTLHGGRITKIHQPYPTDLLLHIRAGGMNHKLLISANHSFPRIYLTNESFSNPQEPPVFTMLLRKYLEGGIIQSVVQVGLERIIHIDIVSRDELGDLRNLRLIIEIMGRHSNVILLDLDRNTILDGIHHVTPSISSYRIVLPGRPYMAPPEQNKINPIGIDQNTFLSQLSFTEEKLDQQLVESFQGISPLIAKEIVFRAKDQTANQLWESFNQICLQIQAHSYLPNIVLYKKNIYSVIELTHLNGKVQTFSSISSCLQNFYQTKAANDLNRQISQDLLRVLQVEKNKNLKKQEKLLSTLQTAEKAEEFKIWGELITSYQYQINQGDSEVFLPNYYEENEPLIRIVLDPLRSPNENAQMYFKKYTKAKNSLIMIEKQLSKSKEEVSYIDEVISQIELADQNSLNEIREELIEQGYLRARKKNRKEKKGKNTAPKIERYLSSEGFPILVGRNNLQNEYLTNRLAKNSDTWMHTKDIPGSHVVISGEKYGDQTLKEAAMLAAYYSKGRNSSSVPVDYTLIRHVHKPNGAKLGFVIYDHQKTLYVTPDEEWINRLQKDK